MLLAASLLAWPLAGQAQTSTRPQPWPASGPIRLVAVYPPGGSVDQVARILGTALQQQLGHRVITENKGGASGAIGTAEVARGAADGSVLGVVFDTHGVNPALQPKIGFDTRHDLTTVALLGTSPMVISAHADLPWRNFADVAQASKAGGKGLSYGSIGNGSLGHLAITLLAKAGRLDLVHVPYKGGGPLMQDAIAGHVPLSIGSVFVAKPHIDSKRLRPLAVTTAQRPRPCPTCPPWPSRAFATLTRPPGAR